MSVLDLFANYRIVPIVVLHKPENAGKLADALVEGGLPAAEIAFRTQGAEQIVRTLADRGDMLVGAGTVLNADQVDLAVDAGAVGVGAVLGGHLLDPGALDVAAIGGRAFDSDTEPLGAVLLGGGVGCGHAGFPQSGAVGLSLRAWSAPGGHAATRLRCSVNRYRVRR